MLFVEAEPSPKRRRWKRMSDAKKRLPHYESPPVVEVVCGIQFESLKELLAPHLGLLWERYKLEYPSCEEAAPLAKVIERVGDASPEIGIDLVDRPPLPRVFFVRADGTRLIQVQRDRFLHNWKRVKKEDEYPRYGMVISLFRQHLQTFEKFLRDKGLGSLKANQYEMSYVNQIPMGEGWSSLSDIGSVFPDFAWRKDQRYFLPAFEASHWRTAFPLQDGLGRLHVSMRQGATKEDPRLSLLFELTVRGMGTDTSRAAMWDWFGTAREWIVRGFTDLTGESIQKNVWKRRR